MTNSTQMHIYLVGGAVRDQLLNKPVKERDWVVIGATPKEMIALGYKPVGKDFPVFLHPKTHEEYALGRSEKKVAPGYQGFTFHTSPNITLEEDLLRRDLTINAIAQDENGDLFDPYHGIADLEHKTLRHVSQAFVEDPVRLLRLARFAAYLPDFTIAPATLDLLKTMVANGEVDALVPERVWAECVKSCHYEHIQPFFTTLQQSLALEKIFPQLDIAQLDFTVFTKAHHQHLDKISKWAALWHNVDQPLTQTLMHKLKIPKQWLEQIQLVQTNKNFFNTFNHLNAEDILQQLKHSDALRRPERFLKAMDILSCCLNKPIPPVKALIGKLKQINIKQLVEQGLKGEILAKHIDQRQIKTVQQFLKDYHA